MIALDNRCPGVGLIYMEANGFKEGWTDIGTERAKRRWLSVKDECGFSSKQQQFTHYHEDDKALSRNWKAQKTSVSLSVSIENAESSKKTFTDSELFAYNARIQGNTRLAAWASGLSITAPLCSRSSMISAEIDNLLAAGLQPANSDGK